MLSIPLKLLELHNSAGDGGLGAAPAVLVARGATPALKLSTKLVAMELIMLTTPLELFLPMEPLKLPVSQGTTQVPLVASALEPLILHLPFGPLELPLCPRWHWSSPHRRWRWRYVC